MADSVSDRVICELCGNSYKNKNQLNKHKRQVHKIIQRKIKCPVQGCLSYSSQLEQYRNHLKEKHNENVGTKVILNFKNREEFDKWLVEEEKTTSTHFFQPRGEQKYADYCKRTYLCHRSGTYVSEGRGERRLKAQGSCKIGYYCTAQIIILKSDKSFVVTYYKDHFGHSNSLEYLPLQKEDKKAIAGKLLEGVKKTEILRDIRSSCDGNTERRHLITYKDIDNIKRTHGIRLPSDSTVKANDEEEEAWFDEMEKFVNSPDRVKSNVTVMLEDEKEIVTWVKEMYEKGPNIVKLSSCSQNVTQHTKEHIMRKFFSLSYKLNNNDVNNYTKGKIMEHLNAIEDLLNVRCCHDLSPPYKRPANQYTDQQKLILSSVK